MAKSSSVRALIKHLEPEELQEVIVELCKLSKKNRQFLELYLQGSDVVDVAAVVEEGRQKVRLHLWGRGQLPKLDLRGARSAVHEYGKVLKAYPREAADLKLYYVELGTEITNDSAIFTKGFITRWNPCSRASARMCSSIPTGVAHFPRG